MICCWIGYGISSWVGAVVGAVTGAIDMQKYLFIYSYE
jgi:hypothetical protein